MAHTMSPAQTEALETGYARDDHKVRGLVTTVRALHRAGLVTDPVRENSGASAYLTTAGLDSLESGS